ncbi:MAG: DedA family protein [Desulfobulbaceae bacterium]|nr:DedA family protein [Desulfobulbaceae bacterium]
METFFLDHGLPALFLLSFLASSVIPLGSEWLVVALILQGYEVVPVVTVATIGNYLGGCTTYGIGYLGSTFVMHKILRISDRETGKAMTIYSRYGSWSLLFSWLPIIGDPLCLVAGSLKLHPLIFSIFVFSGKLARYWLLAQITVLGANIG